MIPLKRWDLSVNHAKLFELHFGADVTAKIDVFIIYEH